MDIQKNISIEIMSKKYLKGKMTKDGIQLVSVTNHFKFQAPDGKLRAADALRKSGTVLVTHFESEIDRLVYHLYEVKQVPVPAF